MPWAITNNGQSRAFSLTGVGLAFLPLDSRSSLKDWLACAGNRCLTFYCVCVIVLSLIFWHSTVSTEQCHTGTVELLLSDPRLISLLNLNTDTVLWIIIVAVMQADRQEDRSSEIKKPPRSACLKVVETAQVWCIQTLNPFNQVVEAKAASSNSYT